MKTRSRTEIIGLVLQALEGEPLTRSKIMYQAMLGFSQATAYTSFLTERGLLSYVTLDKKYAITEKGRKFLSLFNKTNQLLNTSLGDIDFGDDTETSNNNHHQSQSPQWMMPLQQQQQQQHHQQRQEGR